MEQVKLPKSDETQKETEDLRAIEHLGIEYNYSQQVTQVVDHVVDQLINQAVHNFITTTSLNANIQKSNLLDRRKLESLAINCSLKSVIYNKKIIDCHNNFFEIFSYLDIKDALSLSTAASIINESLLNYLNIYTPIVLSKLDPEDLNKLHFLSKVRETNLTKEDKDLVDKLKNKYLPGAQSKINTLNATLTKDIDYKLSYEDIIKVIKYILAIRYKHQPYQEVDALLPWISKINKLFGNNLTYEHIQNLKNLRFFRSQSGPANSIGFNKSAMNSLLNPWPNFCGANPYMIIKYLYLH